MPRSRNPLVLVLAMSVAGFCHGDRMQETVAESLLRHNISLTSDALLYALQSPDDEVRPLAALMLAEDKATEAVPFIAAALAAEAIPSARLDLAMALAQLGDEQGLSTLTATCADTQASASLRLDATINMLNLGNDSCPSAVLDILRTKEEHDYLTSALVLAPRFRHLGNDPEQEMLSLVTASLSDEEPNARLNAGDALAAIGKSSSVPHLEEAIANEGDQTVRSRLEGDLWKLRKRIKAR